MPITITLSNRLAERIAALAADVGQPIKAFVELALQSLLDANIELRDGIPAFRMPPDASVPTSADVDRFLHSDLHHNGRPARRERARRCGDANERTSRAGRSRNTNDEDDPLLDENDDWDERAGGYTEIAEPYRAPAKVGRNEPCPCDSGKKYKKCCGQ